MNDWYFTSVDRSALPQAMLPMFKTHCRISFTDDDQYLQLCLVRSIDLFERHAGWSVFARLATWNPPASQASAILLPVMPVSTFIVELNSVDVSDEYRIQQDQLDGYFIRKSGEPIPAGLNITLTVGFADIAEMPPSVTDIAFRIGAHLYENRESVTSYSLDQVPQWMNDLLLGNWIPRA